MLTTLRIRHFKAWQDTGLVRLAPLTLILGEHGTGKSSLGQALAARCRQGLPAQTQVDVVATPPETTEQALQGLRFIGPHAAPAGTETGGSAQHLRWLQAMGLATPTESPEPLAAHEPARSTLHAQAILQATLPPQAADTVWLEHPESHLHPKAQAVLMDAFIAAVQVPTMQLVLETHSEALLNRLLRRVAEGVISPEAIAIHLCRNRQGQASLETLHLNAWGEITPWPTDLFNHDMTDIAARTLAAMRRRQTQHPEGSQGAGT